MNKWVLLLLIGLAFVAGWFASSSSPPTSNSALSPEVSSRSPLPQSSPSPTPEPTIAATPSIRPTGTHAPHFGTPPTGSEPTTASHPGSSSPALVKGEAKAIIFSPDAHGRSFTQFAPSTPKIFVILTPNGIPDEARLVASYRSAIKQGEPFSSPVPQSGPPRRRIFELTPPKQGWTPGAYQVVIKPYKSEQILSLARFEIEKSPTTLSTAYPKPGYLELSKDSNSEEALTVFNRTDPHIFLRIDTSQVPQKAQVRTVWSAVEAKGLTPGELVAVSEIQAPGPGQDAIFTFDPPKEGYYPGSYQVDIYYDQQYIGNQAFFIESSLAKAESSPIMTATP